MSIRLAILFLSFTLLACGVSKPTRFYLLSPVPPVGEVQQAHSGEIGVGPITLPQYLERPQILSRVTDSQIELKEFDQWAEDLEKQLGRVMAINIAQRLGVLDVELYPFSNSKNIRYQVEVVILRLESSAYDDNVRLQARWILRQNTNGKEIHKKVFDMQEPADAKDINSQVQAMNTLIAKLSDEIVSDLNN